MWALALALLGLAASSLATAIPRYSETSAYKSRRVSDKRMTTANLAILAQFNFEPFALTNISLDCQRVNSTANYNCSVEFDWHDANSVKQNNVTSCTCNQSWSWDGVSVIGGDDISQETPYEPCWQDDMTHFAMRLLAFHGPGNFTLQLAHQYHDSENFTAPWDYPTTFAQPTIVMPLAEKSENHIKHYTRGVVNGTVIGISN